MRRNIPSSRVLGFVSGGRFGAVLVPKNAPLNPKPLNPNP